MRAAGEDGQVRTGPLAVAGWVVAATLTLGVSWSAVQVVRSAATPADLAVTSTDSLPVPTESSSAPPSATATAGPAPTPTVTPAGRSMARSGVGGTVVVRCTGGAAQLVRAIPKQGFTVDTDDSSVEVRFTSGDHRTEIKASCAGGEPRFTVEEDGDRGGDNSGPGGGGNSGPGGGGDG
jgi:hypothetical protein